MKYKIVTVVALMVGMQACTDPGETTGMYAAGGGAMGAGLGAIIGSSSGDAGSGLVIGGVLGAATGALVGNSFEAQRKLLDAQQAAIAKSEEDLRRNQAQLEDLRRLRKGEDQPRARLNATQTKTYSAQIPEKSRITEKSRTPEPPIVSKEIQEKTITEKSIDVTDSTPVAHARVENNNSEFIQQEEGKTQKVDLNTPDCIKAAEEVTKAELASDVADQLFRYRRALRSCPQNADYHLKLAVVYKKLGRNEDAAFEVREAQKLDPKLSLDNTLISQKQDTKPARY